MAGAKGVWAAAAVLALGTFAAVGGRAVRRVVVEGDSMLPALRPGDRLLVVRLPPFRAPRPGDVVAAPDPREPRRLLVKRVASVAPGARADPRPGGTSGTPRSPTPRGSVVLRGDNVGASTDSRTFGAVPRRSVWGLAWYRYAPAARAGRLH